MVDLEGVKKITSEVIAYRKDTKGYPQGCGTRRRTFGLATETAPSYQGVGESDRFTHKYVKQFGVGSSDDRWCGWNARRNKPPIVREISRRAGRPLSER